MMNSRWLPSVQGECEDYLCKMHPLLLSTEANQEMLGDLGVQMSIEIMFPDTSRSGVMETWTVYAVTPSCLK
jgi:hypothetical protein